MKDNNEIVYQLTIEDIQEVAIQELDRELTKEEIKRLIDPIAEKIPWYDVIADAINDQFGEPETSADE
ncbi:MAG: hypothetical protein M3R47_18745 [Chloroflexota bacterium]|nr:hypothetical protein [Chloroflexota bacterium]